MGRPVEGTWPLAGSITVELEGERRILCLRGGIDSAVVARFKSEYGRDLPAVHAIDAADVTFISSTGIAVLLRCSEAAVAAGWERPVLRSASHVMDRVLHLAGLDTALPRSTTT